ncbi:hypothetical protein CONPUDRAFT_102074 [Coniophora puteana RWD-64-598 SS2]|uniref:Protein kinase domain-containing protein n=1 Tax=Coniophora puteana (strain RWD-64-598) TaxID=741705 RepID=A0A5M3MXI7_CONPW|nr:uncharacterized protein CONPUDRAFT_102074 [Coniophora puteana RWD-64-598 SS2]EIW83341.1 hypothetical protein CONPUDRAFT_102074 [Coniophora puteana RWD-64-598 SS2]
MAGSQATSGSAQNTTPSMFSTLTLTGINNISSITMNRGEDFPPHQFDLVTGSYVSMGKWGSSQGPQGAGHLSLRLGKRISGGGGGVVYEAEILTFGTKESGVAPSHPLPLDQKLCIKVARPNRCRTLAREAWMYRKLGGLRGVISPQFYGLFTASLSETQAPFPPEEDLVRLKNDDLTQDEFLPDDDGPIDGLGGRDGSKWCEWRPDPEAPMLAVLVMSGCGPAYTQRDHWDSSTQEDVCAVLDDLSRASVLHGDLRPPNLVRAPANATPCELHQCVHKWNVIDLARASAVEISVDAALYLKTDRTPEEDLRLDMWDLFLHMQQTSYKTERFDL